MMSLYEEQMLFRQLRQQAERNALNPELRRLYRKLSLRNTKRSVGEEPFNFDRLVAKLAGQEWSCPISRNNSQPKVVGVSNVLDRFQKGVPSGSAASDSRLNISFRMRLFGSPEDLIPPSIVSPYTGRYISIHNICIFLSISSHRRAELFHCFLFVFGFCDWQGTQAIHPEGLRIPTAEIASAARDSEQVHQSGNQKRGSETHRLRLRTTSPHPGCQRHLQRVLLGRN